MELLRRFWAAWKRIGRAIGDFIGRLVLTLLYFTVVIPFGLGVRFFADPLEIKLPERPSMWRSRTSAPASMDEASRQF